MRFLLIEFRKGVNRRVVSRPRIVACDTVRFRRDRFSPTGELGYSGIRGAVGLGYRFTVQATLLVNTDILLLN